MSILDREYFLTIDLYNATVSKNKKEIKFYNTDRNTSILYVDVIDLNEDGSTKYLSSDDLIGLTLNLNAIRPKTIDVENAIGIIDESFKDYAVYKFELPLSFTGQAGEVILEFSFSDMKENGERLTIDSTHYTVKRSKLIDLNEAISTNEDKNVLEELIAQVQTVKNINDNTPSDIETYSSKKIENILTYKVSKEEGKGLSTNDLTNELKTVYDNAKTEVENARGTYDSLKDRLNNSDAQYKATKQEVETERQRINNLTTLNEGSTTGDAELIDGRIDNVGFSYPNIGENIRSFQEMIYNSGDLKIPCGTWENGIISTTSGNNSEVDKAKFARIKEFIGVPIGKTLTFNVMASNDYIPKLTVYYYDQNKTFIKSQAVENKAIEMQYPYIKLCYFYQSTPADVKLEDAMATRVTTKVKFDGLFEKIPQLEDLFEKINKIPSMIGTVSANKTIDFNDYNIGYYFISCNSSQAETYPLINAPFNAKWGYYELISIPFTTNFTIQFAICSNGAKRGVFLRTYNSENGTTQIDWKIVDSDLSRSFKEYIALGDSITWGHISGSGTTDNPFVRADYPYPTTVANSLGLNVTYGAQTGCGWLQLSGNKTAISIVDSIDFSKYNLVTLAFGRNDYAGNKPLGNKTDIYPTQNTILGAINYCLNKIYTDAPYINVIVITPLNEVTKGNATSNYAYGTVNTQGYTLKQLCTAIRELCEEKNVNCIDNSTGSLVTAYNCDKGIFVDKLHPTNNFYHTLGQYYAGKIGSFFRASKNH